MLAVHQLTKRYGDTLLFANVSFTVNAGERVGLLGPNGCGKTTILRIIAGEESATGGHISLTPGNLRLGYLPQGLELAAEAAVRDVLYPQAGQMAALETELERLSAALADRPDDRATQQAFARALDQLSDLDAATDQEAAAPILAGLNLDHLDLDAPVGLLSGGQKTRLGLARLLISAPQLLLLDEPTNHLDITGLEWLEDWLASYPAAALLVSHDRTFLDRTVTRIVALDPVEKSVRSYVGNYSDYVETVIRARDKQWGQWRDQVVEAERLKRDARQTMAKAVRKENATRDSTQRRYARKVASRAKAKEKRLDRYLASDERVEKPRLDWQMKLDFADMPPGSQEALRLQNLTVGYSARTPLLSDITLTLRAGERIALIGPNGVGKTTLLRTIAGIIPPLAGEVRLGPGTRPGYLSQEQDTLAPYEDALAAILATAPMSETEARSFLHYFLFAGDDVFVPVAELSFGERARLMLALLVAQGCNLLILDEPINHLDVPSRERFEQAMTAYDGSVLAVVHDRYFVDRFATGLWVAEDGRVRLYIDRAEYLRTRTNADS